MRAEWVEPDVFELLLTAMMPENRLALQVSLATGLRIGDVLALRTDKMKRRQTVREQKTGKSRRVYWPKELYDSMMAQAGRVFVFEGRLSIYKSRTRDAVYKDLRRVARLYRVDGRAVGVHLSPHSARKLYAVQAYKRSGSLPYVKELLNHDDEAVTVLYAMADQLTAAQHRGRKKKKKAG